MMRSPVYVSPKGESGPNRSLTRRLPLPLTAI